jgi:hypothetical protein
LSGSGGLIFGKVISLSGFTNQRRFWRFMKTIQEYMNDPRLLNDPGMAEALEPVREIHAARLMIQDETAGMTAVQKSE